MDKKLKLDDFDVDELGYLKVPAVVTWSLIWALKDLLIAILPLLPKKFSGGSSANLEALITPVPFFTSLIPLLIIAFLYFGRPKTPLLYRFWPQARWLFILGLILCSASFLFSALSNIENTAGQIYVALAVINGYIVFVAASSRKFKVVFSNRYIELKHKEFD
jgi:drug/metabolite transporter (DMT)-like permease